MTMIIPDNLEFDKETLNGVLKTSIRQKKTGLDVSKIIEDTNNAVKYLEQELDAKYLGRDCLLCRIQSRITGHYVSPTNMKAWLNCPEGVLWNLVTPRFSGTATSIGTTVHKILQDFYDLPGEERTINKLHELEDNQIKIDRQPIDEVKYYIDGFIKSGDYIGIDESGNSEQPMNHNNLECFNEVFYKEKDVEPLGVQLPMPIYCLVDRIDLRTDEKGNMQIYIVDYKTGKYFRQESIDAYTDQLIFYTWVVEHAYGIPVSGSLLHTLGDPKRKFVDLDVHSKVRQSMVIDKIFQYEAELAETSDTMFLPCKQMQYCNSCGGKNVCPIHNDITQLPGYNGKYNEIELEIDFFINKNQIKYNEPNNINSN